MIEHSWEKEGCIENGECGGWALGPNPDAGQLLAEGSLYKLVR